MPLLAIFVARPCSPHPIMALAVLATSAAPLTPRSQINGLDPLGCRLRLHRSPIPPLRLSLLPSLSLQLYLPLPGICLKLGKCPVCRVRYELTYVPPQNAQISTHTCLLGGHVLWAEHRMKHPHDHRNRLSTMLEGQKLLGQTLPLHLGNVLIPKHSSEPLPGHYSRRIMRTHKLPPVLRSQAKLVQREPNSQMLRR